MLKQALYIIALIILLVLVAAFGIAIFGALKKSPPAPAGAASSTLVATSSLAVTSPLPNALVQSPLSVSGEAVGNWYFEASFPVKLVDSAGNVLAQTPARALGNWMTAGSVPFEAVIEFSPPATSTGYLVFQNDNPSGNPATAREVRIPVRFR